MTVRLGDQLPAVGEVPQVGRRGGRMRSLAVPFHQPWLGREEERAISGAVKKGMLKSNGPIARSLEAQLCGLLGVRHALLMNSCTASLEIALRSIDVAGGEVILPSFSFSSTAAVVVAAGARPVFVDVEPVHLTLDPERVRQAISAQTRAVIHVEYGGFPGAIEEIRDIAWKAGVPFIEDAAHALGSQYLGRSMGAWGTIGCISFHETKILTCGEGGLFLTDDDKLAEFASVYREFGTNRSAFLRGEVDHYEWLGPGSSTFLAEPLAALLEAQFKKLPAILKRRRAIAQRYLTAFTDLARAGFLELPIEVPKAQVNWHAFYLLLPHRQTADGLIRWLGSARIDACRHFHPLHLSAYAMNCGYSKGGLRVSESVAGRLVRLPIYPTLSCAQQQRVIREVIRFFRSRRHRVTSK